MKIDLSGEWELYVVSPEHPAVTAPEQLEKLTPVTGKVPGNIELDLCSAGFAEDPFLKENAKAYRKFEFYDFWYQRKFSLPPKTAGKTELVFEGVDCFAEYFLNGEKIGESENALMAFRFPVTLKPENTLSIRIKSAEIAARKYPDEPAAIAHMHQVYSTLYTRKPAHASGWDIAPRLLLGGIWRSVYAEIHEDKFYFTDIWLQTAGLEQENTAADMRLYYRFEAGSESIYNFRVRFTGKCKDSVFTIEDEAFFTNDRIDFKIENPRLWFPRGYGEPELYDLEAVLMDANGKTVAVHHTTFGVRTVALERTELNIDQQGIFRFVINGIPVRVLGSNHVPIDALHSRDAERMEQVLDLYDDLQCNMIRCWGGSVYESDEFFDYCDRHGMMVWQDFMFGCAVYPQNQTFFDMIRPEAEQVVRRLRRHPSLVLWCGDNECDQSYWVRKVSPDTNKVNRQILADVVFRLDPSRPYLPSSPYISKAAESHVFAGNLSVLEERHLWGTRETFRLPFYYQSGGRFISETGWHGSPVLSSLKRFLSPEQLVYDDTASEWDYHSSNPFGKDSNMAVRSQLMRKQLMEYFTNPPQDLDGYVKATQIHQAEACKFMVENCRLDPACSGILWWNVIDCWPQFSDSVVDYYFAKKLAYHYLKRVQSPFCIICSDPKPWNSQVTAVNDTNERAVGEYEIELENGERITGTFDLAPRSREVLNLVRARRAENQLWIIRWKNNNVSGANHYISGNLVMDFNWYMERLQRIAQADNSFNAAAHWQA